MTVNSSDSRELQGVHMTFHVCSATDFYKLQYVCNFRRIYLVHIALRATQPLPLGLKTNTLLHRLHNTDYTINTT